MSSGNPLLTFRDHLLVLKKKKSELLIYFTAEARNHVCVEVFCHLWGHTNCKILLTQIHSGFKLYSLICEDGWEQPKHAAQSVGCNKFVVFDSNTNLSCGEFLKIMTTGVYLAHTMLMSMTLWICACSVWNDSSWLLTTIHRSNCPVHHKSLTIAAACGKDSQLYELFCNTVQLHSGLYKLLL